MVRRKVLRNQCHIQTVNVERRTANKRPMLETALNIIASPQGPAITQAERQEYRSFGKLTSPRAIGKPESGPGRHLSPTPLPQTSNSWNKITVKTLGHLF